MADFKNQLNKTKDYLGNNLYILVIIGFLIWMIWIDDNSYVNQKAFDRQIKKLEKTIDFYETRIKQNETEIRNLKNDSFLERYAREKYFLKRKGRNFYHLP